MTLGNHHHHRELSRRERGDGSTLGLQAPEHHGAGYLGADVAFAAGRLAQCKHQVRLAAVLRQVATHAHLEQVRGIRAVAVDAERDEIGRRSRPGQATRDLQPAHVGDADVEEHDIGAQVARGTHRLLAAGSLADDLEIRLVGQQFADPRANDGMLIDDQNCLHCCSLLVCPPSWPPVRGRHPATAARPRRLGPRTLRVARPRRVGARTARV
jgi:hypothetical protein